jgi:RNA polymerase sigma-70 factor (ECF subfamily)
VAIDVENYYRRYGPMVLRRCRKLLKDEESSVEAMQDTFVQLIKYEKSLTDEAPSSLLYRMATNVCLNKIRSSKRKPEQLGDDVLSKIAETHEVESKISARNLIARLFRGERESTGAIAVLHLVDGMTLEEVASEVGMSVSGVRKRLRPLRSRLGDLLGEAI